ncbi:SET domain-containing protein-lysine N-methyltransferase [Balamuthia mandrillaris]
MMSSESMISYMLILGNDDVISGCHWMTSLRIELGGAAKKMNSHEGKKDLGAPPFRGLSPKVVADRQSIDYPKGQGKAWFAREDIEEGEIIMYPHEDQHKFEFKLEEVLSWPRERRRKFFRLAYQVSKRFFFHSFFWSFLFFVTRLCRSSSFFLSSFFFPLHSSPSFLPTKTHLLFSSSCPPILSFSKGR